MWYEAARELGAEVERLSPTVLEFRRGDARARISHRSTTPFTDSVSSHVAADKPVSYRLLGEAGLPIPEHVMAPSGEYDAAQAFLLEAPSGVIVKPASGGGGLGVVGGVRTAQQLVRALENAWRFHPQALVERHVIGQSYRLLFLDGELLDVIRSSPPCVIGDGKSTIETLVFQEFEARIAAGPSGLKPLDVDLDMLIALENLGYRLDSILASGEVIAIKSASNYGGRELVETVVADVGEEIVASARKAAAVLGVRLAGVDVITTDPHRSLSETGGVVLEVNAVPGLTHHYNVSDAARATRVCVPILAALLGSPPDGRRHEQSAR